MRRLYHVFNEFQLRAPREMCLYFRGEEDIISKQGLFTSSNSDSLDVYDAKVYITRVKRIEVWLLGSRRNGSELHVRICVVK